MEMMRIQYLADRSALIEAPSVMRKPWRENHVWIDPNILNAIQMAEHGNDRPLLPYQPTPTINPGRPRTLAAGYDDRTRTLRIKFREGEIYEYYQVPPSVWWQFQRAQSPGRYINTKLNNYPYKRGLEI